MLGFTLYNLQILEPCQSSLAYQPPNPWTMGILGLLAEIYSMPNLKMNLKFDIEVQFLLLEFSHVIPHLHNIGAHNFIRLFLLNPIDLSQVLFKNLGVDLKEIAPTSLLKDRKREVEGNPDFSNKDVGASQSQMVSEVKTGIMAPLNQVELPLEVAPSSNSAGHNHLMSQVGYAR